MTLTVGHITYANCAPFFHFLEDCGFNGRIVDGVPFELNRLLAAGELDLCPSSSIEYARHASDYLLLPGHSISSMGAVQSVLLFTDRPLNELSEVPIQITGESATSVALLQVLLQEFFQVGNVTFNRTEPGAVGLDGQQLPLLLIGDRALQAKKEMTDSCMVLDLGELWYHFTGLPFVFALWIVNRESARQKGEEIREFLQQLTASRAKSSRSYAALAQAVPESAWMGEKELVEYWQRVSYDLDPLQLEGLRCFYLLLEKNGLIEYRSGARILCMIRVVATPGSPVISGRDRSTAGSAGRSAARA